MRFEIHDRVELFSGALECIITNVNLVDNVEIYTVITYSDYIKQKNDKEFIPRLYNLYGDDIQYNEIELRKRKLTKLLNGIQNK